MAESLLVRKAGGGGGLKINDGVEVNLVVGNNETINAGDLVRFYKDKRDSFKNNLVGSPATNINVRSRIEIGDNGQYIKPTIEKLYDNIYILFAHNTVSQRYVFTTIQLNGLDFTVGNFTNLDNTVVTKANNLFNSTEYRLDNVLVVDNVVNNDEVKIFFNQNLGNGSTSVYRLTFNKSSKTINNSTDGNGIVFNDSGITNQPSLFLTNNGIRVGIVYIQNNNAAAFFGGATNSTTSWGSLGSAVGYTNLRALVPTTRDNEFAMIGVPSGVDVLYRLSYTAVNTINQPSATSSYFTGSTTYANYFQSVVFNRGDLYYRRRVDDVSELWMKEYQYGQINTFYETGLPFAKGGRLKKVQEDMAIFCAANNSTLNITLTAIFYDNALKRETRQTLAGNNQNRIFSTSITDVAVISPVDYLVGYNAITTEKLVIARLDFIKAYKSNNLTEASGIALQSGTAGQTIKVLVR